MTYIRNTWLLNRGVLVVVACAWLVGGGAWARETKSDNRLQERFFREGPAKWEEYSRRAQRLQGRINYKLKGSNGDITAVNTYAVKMNESCKLIATSLTTTKAGKLTLEGYQVTAANSDYAFALRRKKPDLPWVVTKLINLETASFP